MSDQTDDFKEGVGIQTVFAQRPMKHKSPKKIAVKEEKRRRHQRAVDAVREATRRVLSTPNKRPE